MHHKFTEDHQFYPTPEYVADLMDFNPFNKKVADLSAGKGDLLKYCLKNGAKKVLACEIDPILRKFLVQDNIHIIGEDCFDLSSIDVHGVDLIVLNPPFRNAPKHINHAFNIMPEGATLVAILNQNSISEAYYSRDKHERELKSLIDKYGFTRKLGKDLFKGEDVEREANVNIALVQLNKPISSDSDDFNFDDFYYGGEDDYYNLEDNSLLGGLIQYDEMTDLINRVRGSILYYKEFLEKGNQISDMLSPFGFKRGDFSYKVSYKINTVNFEEFQILIYQKAWREIFNLLNLEKYLTTNVQKKLDLYFEEREKMPFTKENIYRMAEYIIGNSKSMQINSLKSAIEHFTSMSYKWDTKAGWKTNKENLLNYKFIVPHCCTRGYTHIHVKYGDDSNRVDDLMKIICIMKGWSYNNPKDKENRRIPFRDLLDINKPKTGQQMDWNDTFKVKCYYSGTAHFEFKHEEDWARLNLAYNSIMGNPIAQNNAKVKSTWKNRKKTEWK